MASDYTYRPGLVRTAPPPDPPERPEGVEPRPRWPWWYGVLALVLGFIVSNVLATPIFLATGDDLTPVGALLSTLILNGALIGTAVAFAARSARPRLWHFGLRPARFWPAVGWTALGYLAFIVFVAVYAVAIGAPEEQTTPEDVGADEGDLALLNAGLLFVIIAPIGEEIFFRGFLYRSLRGSLSVWPAALIAGGIFGLIHIVSGVEAVPILAALGVMLSLVYEKTGSLYPCIAIHAVNNTFAYAGTTDASAALAAAFGLPMLAAAVLVPRFLTRRAPAHAR